MKRGDICWINATNTVGGEIQKRRLPSSPLWAEIYRGVVVRTCACRWRSAVTTTTLSALGDMGSAAETRRKKSEWRRGRGERSTARKATGCTVVWPSAGDVYTSSTLAKASGRCRPTTASGGSAGRRR
jgi:hypothetical protein